jgi:pimeloyl-ACP methyl ester carboxylesterase
MGKSMGVAWTVGLVLAAALLLAGCVKPPALSPPPGVALKPLRSISVLEARVLLALSGVKGMPVAHAVNLYRMEYPGVRGRRLSGLLALPRGAAPGRVVSFQHGTATTRSAVPSKPDGTGLAAAILFAGNGYTLLAPDYPGMGVSPGKHPYYVAQAIGPAVAGMVTAAQQIEGVPDDPAFLSGFSEGGWASLAALGVLEAQGRPVLGSAQVAGAYDLRRVSLPAALRGGSPSHSLYLAYAAWGQADHYGHRLDSVLTPQSAALAERLFAGAKPKEILAALPAQPRTMFNADFLAAFDTDGRHWMLESFAANSLTRMTPRAPVRMYYGSKDVDVVPAEALAAAKAMTAGGADVTAVDVGPVGHDASMLAAAPAILAWLRDLEAER